MRLKKKYVVQLHKIVSPISLGLVLYNEGFGFLYYTHGLIMPHNKHALHMFIVVCENNMGCDNATFPLPWPYLLWAPRVLHCIIWFRVWWFSGGDWRVLCSCEGLGGESVSCLEYRVSGVQFHSGSVLSDDGIDVDGRWQVSWLLFVGDDSFDNNLSPFLIGGCGGMRSVD